MTPSEHFQTPPLTRESPAEGGSIALPPLPRPPALDEAKFVRLSSWLDAALVVVVLLFAFLAASFPVYNPDFFRQLATGRLLLQGEYQFGVDPFVYTADGAYWANHSWLFALLMYGIYHLGTIGGAAVVIFKAIAIAAVAGILMCAGRRRGQSLWIPAACTALAILAASPRFFLQPVVLSYLFLGVTIWLLFAGQGGKRLGWLLVPLFALWVNCDAWFFLGPLAVGLYLVGELLQQRSSHQPAAPARDTLAGAAGWLMLAVGVAACLLNPHHIHALTLPPEFGLTAAGDLLDNDPQFRTLFFSPLRKESYSKNLGLSVAGLAYGPLLLLSLASFALSIGRLSWPRLVVWIGFALLSFYNMRTIPFFALVAGPILSLNCLDFLARRFAGESSLTPAWRNGLLGGRIVTLLLGLALLIATVPGWLQNQPQTRRLLGWSVHPDASLESMARTIHSWRQAGRLPNDPHWFNFNHEVADYMAWFAPGERVFLDANLLYFRKAAEDYLTIRKGFQEMVRRPGDAEGDVPAATTDWRKILHEDWNVNYWISDYFDTQRSGAIPDLIVILFSRPPQKEWVLCALSGRMAIFAWRDPQQPAADPSQGLALDLKRSAFGPKAEPAPPRGEEPTPPRRWWETYWEEWWQPTPRHSSDQDAVGLYDFYYQVAEQPKLMEESARVWRQGAAAGAVACSLPFGPVPNSLLALSWCCTYHDLYPAGAGQPVRQPLPSDQLALYAQNMHISSQFMETPSLYLSVRAARRALAVNPDDGATYFRLGQTYQRLRELPQERIAERFGSRLADLRRIQTIAAFQNCLRFPIDDEKAFVAHQTLAQIFMQRRYVDVAVHHMREALNKRLAAGVPLGASPEDFKKNLDNASAEVTRRESEVQRLRDRYELTVAAKTGLDRVNAALEMGLAETALEALEQASADSVSTSNDMAIIKRVTAVLLDLGQLDRARELLPDPEGRPVKPEEMDLYLNLAAARGDYEKADRLLADNLQNAWHPPLGQPALPSTADRLGLLAGQALLGEARRLTGIPSMPLLFENASDFWIRRWRYLAIVTALDLAQQRAELHLLRGWLALEAGHSDKARKSFRSALDQIVSEKTWIPEVNKLNAWLAPEQEIPQIQQLNMRHAVVQDLSKHYLSWVEKEP